MMKVKELSTPLATAMRLADKYAEEVAEHHAQKWVTRENYNPKGLDKSREVLKAYLKKNFSVANGVQP